MQWPINEEKKETATPIPQVYVRNDTGADISVLVLAPSQHELVQKLDLVQPQNQSDFQIKTAVGAISAIQGWTMVAAHMPNSAETKVVSAAVVLGEDPDMQTTLLLGNGTALTAQEREMLGPSQRHVKHRSTTIYGIHCRFAEMEVCGWPWQWECKQCQYPHHHHSVMTTTCDTTV